MDTLAIDGGGQLRSDAAPRYNRMAAAFRKTFGHAPKINSSLRTYAEQKRLYDGWIARRPGFNLAARPGTSLHERGLSVDLQLTANEKAWLNRNGPTYGFKPTGDSFSPREPWHYDYVGGGDDGTPAISDPVRRAQEKLKTSYPLYAGRLVVDGINGPATKAAVKEFQRRSGLVADGIIGPKTLRALGL